MLVCYVPVDLALHSADVVTMGTLDQRQATARTTHVPVQILLPLKQLVATPVGTVVP